MTGMPPTIPERAPTSAAIGVRSEERRLARPRRRAGEATAQHHESEQTDADEDERGRLRSHHASAAAAGARFRGGDTDVVEPQEVRIVASVELQPGRPRGGGEGARELAEDAVGRL